MDSLSIKLLKKSQKSGLTSETVKKLFHDPRYAGSINFLVYEKSYIEVNDKGIWTPSRGGREALEQESRDIRRYRVPLVISIVAIVISLIAIIEPYFHLVQMFSELLIWW